VGGEADGAALAEDQDAVFGDVAGAGQRRHHHRRADVGAAGDRERHRGAGEDPRAGRTAAGASRSFSGGAGSPPSATVVRLLRIW
jgi:hypothetical protein